MFFRVRTVLWLDEILVSNSVTLTFFQTVIRTIVRMLQVGYSQKNIVIISIAQMGHSSAESQLTLNQMQFQNIFFRIVFCTWQWEKCIILSEKKTPLEVPGFTISFLGVKFSLVLSFSIGTLYTISEFRMDVFWKSFLEENDTLFMDLSRFGVNKYEAINSHHTAARYTTHKEKWSYPS